MFRAAFLGLVLASVGLVVYRLEHMTVPLMRDGGYTHFVVAGAWTLPDGSLSETFKARVDKAVELQGVHKATVIFTGGRNESVKAMEYATLNGGCAEAPCLYENASTTTYENAREAAKLLRNKQAAVAVVSSPYHLGRCGVYFSRFWQKVDVFPAPARAEVCRWDEQQVNFWIDTDSLCYEGHCLPFPRMKLAWLRPCLLGAPYVGAAREVLAWIHNILTFRCTVFECSCGV